MQWSTMLSNFLVHPWLLQWVDQVSFSISNTMLPTMLPTMSSNGGPTIRSPTMLLPTMLPTMSPPVPTSLPESPSKSFLQSPFNVGLVVGVVFMFISFPLIYTIWKKKKGTTRKEEEAHSNFPIPIASMNDGIQVSFRKMTNDIYISLCPRETRMLTFHRLICPSLWYSLYFCQGTGP